MTKIRTLLLIQTFIFCVMKIANAACVDVGHSSALSFEGILTYHIFPGIPNYEDVRKGDTPEPTYIVKLNAPICATGDDFLTTNTLFDQIQVYPAETGEPSQRLWREIRPLVGKRVAVEGRGAFGAHTGHHHAPLLLPITKIQIAPDPTVAFGTPMTTVEAFYLALRAGNGPEASKFVVKEKRSSGPLSASAITNFYGGLFEPLTLIDVTPINSKDYRVRYTYAVSKERRCDGEAIASTTQMNGLNLIQSIRALNGC